MNARHESGARRHLPAILLVLSIIVIVAVWMASRHAFRRRSPSEWHGFNMIARAAEAISEGNGGKLANLVSYPPAIASRTQEERADFLSKALRGEVTEDGLALLRREGRFGPLLDLFPEDGPRWANQAGVAPDQCMAFRLDRLTHRMEVALFTNSVPWRIVRLNDVRP